jgi:hypothetical protein
MPTVMRGTKGALPAAALAAAALAALALAGCGSRGPAPSRVSACASQVKSGVLPQWARSGFSDPKPRIPYELGRSGDIAALVFAYPLLSPPPRTHNNKILWVSRVTPQAGSDLRIAAQRMQGTHALGAPVSRTVTGGPGPSIINLPASGCWRLTLRWSGRVDSLDLDYVANPDA